MPQLGPTCKTFPSPSSVLTTAVEGNGFVRWWADSHDETLFSSPSALTTAVEERGVSRCEHEGTRDALPSPHHFGGKCVGV